MLVAFQHLEVFCFGKIYECGEVKAVEYYFNLRLGVILPCKKTLSKSYEKKHFERHKQMIQLNSCLIKR